MKFFRDLYLRFSTWFTFFLLRWTTNRVRTLIVMLGKDPDRVLFNSAEADVRDFGFGVYHNSADIWSFGKSWVNNSKQHPVYLSRLAWEAKRAGPEPINAVDHPITFEVK